MNQQLLSACIMVLFVLIHIFGGKLRFLQVVPRSVWLSAAGGVAVAYVFVHLLPELAAHQAMFRGRMAPDFLGAIERHSYLVALLGLATFYGFEKLARQSSQARRRAGGEPRPSQSIFWIHLGAFAVYNLLIGYLLLHREAPDVRGLLAYGAAMGLHLLVNDQGLRDHHGRAYHNGGRWLLASAVFLGWLLGLWLAVPQLLLSTLFAFIAGAVVLNVLKEELPEDRESRFSAFAAGATGYAALLLLTG